MNSTAKTPTSRIVGRESELERLESALDDARNGTSAVLVVYGEPGIGKTTVLHAAIDAAAGMRVISTRGIEAESELGFAGLADVLRPLVNHLDGLVPQPRAVVAGVLGLGPPTPADPLGTSAAALALLAAAAEVEPVLVVVDDFQWLDALSQLALVYVARRLEVERVALLLGMREISPHLAAAGLSALEVSKLDDADAASLLRGHVPTIAPAVVDAIVATADGNPLALVELTSFLESEQLTGRSPLPDPLPVNGPVQAAFRERLEGLSEEARRALVVAAIEDAGDPATVTRAAALFGVEAGLEEAEDSGALTLGPPVRFRHPILRSLAVQLASDRDRRSVHAVLASAVGPDDIYRHAWHRGRATLEPDEGAAGMLEEAAAQARARQQFSSAAAASSEAARLSESADERARRLVLAASDHQLVGAFEAAERCIAEALALSSGVGIRAEAHRVRGQGLIATGRYAEAIGLLGREAAQLADVAPDAAALLLAQVALACQPLGRIRDGIEAGRRAVEISARAGPAAQFAANLAYAEALALHGEGQAVADLQEHARAVAPLDDPMVAGMLLQSEAGHLMIRGDHDEARARIEQLIAAARAAGAPSMLVYPLGLLAEIEFRSGRWPQALAAGGEAVELGEQTGALPYTTFALQVLVRVEGAVGHVDAAQAHAEQANAIGTNLGIDATRFYVPAARSFVALTLGDLESAVDHGREVEEISRERELREPAVVLWAPDLIEAYVRLSRHGDACTVLERFSAEAEVTQRTWALAAAARCRGLLEDEYEAAFATAIEHHERIAMPFERARTELCLGERRRRGGRRVDARPPLRASLRTFERLGAHPWAERARAELVATGERVRDRAVALTDELTPHELRVALVVARGATNREAAAELFVSPKTVDFHLRRVYRKLGIRSRAELGRLFAQEPAA